ncbi:MAG: hypothetical protein ACR2GH_17355 [Pseudonocardia sp.]
MGHAHRQRPESRLADVSWRAMVLVAAVGIAAAAAGIGIGATAAEHVAVDETQYLLSAISLAEDGDLDISDELAAHRWSSFAAVEPPTQTTALSDGRQISPHDPLLPILLAGPVAVGGWVGAKLALAGCAGLLAALTLRVAVRRFAVPPRTATTGVALAVGSAPLAVYGQQVYPELPAAVVIMTGVAALTGAVDRRHLALLTAAVLTGPWLSVKYVPVLAVLAALGAVRWRAGRPGDILVAAGVLAAGGAAYLAVHRVVWGGWTAYASGDHFATRGEFAVVGDSVDPFGRALRLVGLLVDRFYGLAAWQPAFLLLVPAASALLVWRPRHGWVLAAPLATAWAVATFAAATMHGFWWAGRHVLVVVPLAVLLILVWVSRSGAIVHVVAATLGAVGVAVHLGLLVDGYTGAFTWVLGFGQVSGPGRSLLPDYRADFWALHLGWCAAFAGLALLAALTARHQWLKVTKSPRS